MIATRSYLGPRLWYLSFIASIVMAAIGLIRSDILSTNPWTATMIYQAASIALAAIAVVGASLATERYRAIRLEVGVIGAGIAVLILTFGAGAVSVVTLFLVSSVVLGVWLCDRDDEEDVMPLAIVATVGAAIYLLLFTLIAPIRINTPAVHGLMMCVPIAAGMASTSVRRRLRVRLSTAPWKIRPESQRTAVEVIGLTVLLFVLFLHAFLAALPERYWDAMVMHLYLPSYVAAHGAWDFDARSYAFAFMPAAVDWMYANFFVLGGEQATRLYNLTALLLLAALVVTILAREASREIAIWIAALFVSLPLAFIESGSLFIENTLTLWITAAVAVVIASGFRPTPRQAIAVLVLLAAATMSKLHGALAAALIGSLLAALIIRQRKPTGVLLALLAVTIIIAAIGCFPYIYAWIRTGNPFFFLYNDLFRSPLFPAVRFVDSRWIGHLNWSFLYEATFASGRFGELTTGALGLTMLFLAPLALVSTIVRPTSGSALCFILAVLIAAPIISEVQYLRYLYPVFPLLLIGASPGLVFLFDRMPTRAPMLAIVVILAVFGVYKLPAAGWILGNFDFIADFSAAGRRALELQTPERIANRMINEAGGDDARVLYTGVPYGALLHGHALYTDWYNATLAADLAGLKTVEDAAALLSRWRVTHVEFAQDAAKPGAKLLGDYLAAHCQRIARLGSTDVYDVHSLH